MAQSPAYLRYSTADGMASSRIFHMLQDREGYLWLATNQGLSRFDGLHFQNYTMADGLSDSDILRLFEDQQGRLWFRSFQQYPSFYWKGEFHTTLTDSLFAGVDKESMRFRAFSPTDSTIAFCLNNSFIYLSGRGTHLTKWQATPTGTFGLVAKLGDAFYGVSNDSIYHFSFQDTIVHFQAVYGYPDGPNVYRGAATANRILFGSNNRSLLLAYEGDSFELLEDSDTGLQYIYADQENRLWGLVPGEGAYRYAEHCQTLADHERLLDGKKVTTIYQDRVGNQWFAIPGEGLLCLPVHQTLNWNTQHGFASANLMSLAMTPQGILLVGDDAGNVYHLKSGQIRHSTLLRNQDGENLVRAIHPLDSTGFVAITDEGCFRYQHQALYSIYPLACKSLTFTDQQLLIGTNGALVNYTLEQDAVDTLSVGRTTIATTDQAGYHWKGTMTGLYSSADQFALNWADSFPPLKQRIIDLIPDGASGLWIALANNSVWRANVHAGKLKTLTNFLAPFPFGVNCLHADDNQHLWIGTNQGIIYHDSAGETYHFDHQQGLASNEVHDLLRQEDTLWVATSDGLSKLIPKQFQQSLHIRRTQLVALDHYRNDSFIHVDLADAPDIRSAYTLPHDADQVEATFAVLPYDLTERFTYQHKFHTALLPFPYFTFRNCWEVLNARERSLERPNANWDFGLDLAAGYYTITSLAKCTNRQSQIAPLQWSLIRLPAWHQTIWPWLTLGLALAYLITGLVRTRLRNMALLTATAQARLATLRAQINPHFIGNTINALQQFFYPPNPREASDYIHYFDQLLRRTLTMSAADFVSLSEEIDYARTYLEMVKLRYGKRFQYSITLPTAVSPQLPFPALFLQPILENATIHGLAPNGVSTIHIRFRTSQERLYCELSDNGQGMNHSTPKRGRTSKGIHILRTKQNLINELYPIDLQLEWIDRQSSESTSGTMVSLSFDLSAAAQIDLTPHST